MRKCIAALMCLAALPLAAAPAAAQGFFPFTIEGRAGLAVPVDDFAPGIETGYFGELTAKYSPLPFTTLYLGWTAAEFSMSAERAPEATSVTLRDSGVRFGGELSVPLSGLMSGIAPYAQVGALFNRAQVRSDGEEGASFRESSERTTGLDLGAGVRIKINRHISVAPEVRFRRYHPDFENEAAAALVDQLSYLGIGLGASFHF